MSLFWSLFKRFEQFLISSAEKSDTKRFLKLNADSRYYRINLNGIRERVASGKEYCSAMGAFFIIEPYLDDGKYKYKVGRYSGEHDKNTPFAKDEGVYLFIKADPHWGKVYEERFQLRVKEDVVVWFKNKRFERYRYRSWPGILG